MFTPRITRMLFAGVVAAGTVLATTGPALADTLIQHSRFHGTGLTLFSARCTAFDTPLTPGGQKCENIELAAANGFETGSGRTASIDAVVSYSVEFLNSAGNIVPSLSRETTGDTFNNGGS